jgi:hypothetical protein
MAIAGALAAFVGAVRLAYPALRILSWTGSPHVVLALGATLTLLSMVDEAALALSGENRIPASDEIVRRAACEIYTLFLGQPYASVPLRGAAIGVENAYSHIELSNTSSLEDKEDWIVGNLARVFERQMAGDNEFLFFTQEVLNIAEASTETFVEIQCACADFETERIYGKGHELGNIRVLPAVWSGSGHSPLVWPAGSLQSDGSVIYYDYGVRTSGVWSGYHRIGLRILVDIYPMANITNVEQQIDLEGQAGTGGYGEGWPGRQLEDRVRFWARGAEVGRTAIAAGGSVVTPPPENVVIDQIEIWGIAANTSGVLSTFNYVRIVGDPSPSRPPLIDPDIFNPPE